MKQSEATETIIALINNGRITSVDGAVTAYIQLVNLKTSSK